MPKSFYLQNGCGLIAEERTRQHQDLGYDELGDDNYVSGELRDAAIAYAQVCDDSYCDMLPDCWPWTEEAFKPGSIEENLVKSGALIAAELDRRYRVFQTECNRIAKQDIGFEVFDALDAYDLSKKRWVGMTPEEFLLEHFQEDYARAKIEAGEKDGKEN